MSGLVSINVEFWDSWEPTQFFGDPVGEKTDEECAEAVRDFIEREGLYRMMTDWNIVHSVNIYVGGILVVQDGRVVEAAS